MKELSRVVTAIEPSLTRQLFNEAKKYFGQNHLIITPKYDGCSFEIYVKGDDITISSRGDGEYGKDFKKHLIYHRTI